MERRILRLARALREAGAPVSTAETLDAGRAALAAGIERRDDLRAALRATLVKDGAFLADFAALFDREFPAGVPRPERRGARGRGGRGAEPGGAGGAAGAPGALAGAAAGERGAPAETGPGRDARTAAGDEARAGAAAGGGVPPRKRGVVPDRSRETAEGREGDEAQDEGGETAEGRAEGGAESEAEIPPPPGRRTAAERRRALAKGFRERWERGEEAAALAAMEELAGRLATRLARRSSRSRRGALDVRATLRANLRHGGVPFAIARRARLRGRRDLVLLADVSGSVRRAAALFLLIIGRLRARFSGVRAFAYTDRPVEIPAALALRPPGEIAEALAGALPVHALSDHGEALRRFNRDFGRAVGGRTVVVVLGDGRNNRFPAQEWELESIARRAHRLVWIVPEPRSLWGSADSAMPAYAPRCDLAVAAPTPGALAAAASEVLASLERGRAGRNKIARAR